MNIVGDILLKNLLPKDKKKALGHKYYPMIENRSAIVNQSPLKIAKEVNTNLTVSSKAAGEMQSSMKNPASERFVPEGKRLIKSNNSQSRSSKSQKRNTRMS